MIPVRGYQGRKVAVLGLGRTGLATAAALTAGGAQVCGWDDSPAAREQGEKHGITLRNPAQGGAALEGLAALFVSPGIAHLYPEPHPAVQAAWASGVPVDNDIGLFFRSLATEDWERFDQAPRVVAITGSNGKSTTSALIHHVLEECGRPSQLAGNIGTAVLGIAPPGNGETVVLELSSYQIELARALTPDIAVFTNLSPDHLERHGGRGGYFAAKRRLFAEGGPDRAVIGVDENEGRFLAGQLSQGAGDDQVIRMSVKQKLSGGEGWSVFARKGFLAEYRKGRQVASIDLREMAGLPGRHNHQNACAAYGVLRALGLSPRMIGPALASFPGLAHRAQFVGEISGVRFVNDSKATNPDAAAHALAAFERVRWIAGGQGKKGGLEALRPHLGHVVKAYLIGESATEIAAFLGDVSHEICETMEKAMAQAAREAEAGDTVLLAPAAASFDQYRDFEARGDDFMALFRALPAK